MTLLKLGTDGPPTPPNNPATMTTQQLKEQIKRLTRIRNHTFTRVVKEHAESGIRDYKAELAKRGIH